MGYRKRYLQRNALTMVISGLRIVTILNITLVISFLLLTWKTQRIAYVTNDTERHVKQDDAELTRRETKCGCTNVKHTNHSAVPKIVHFIWFYDKPTLFRFHHLISILSASQIIKPEEIIVWISVAPIGPYWKEAENKIKNLSLKTRKIPFDIFGNKITVPEHQSSLSRLEVLIEHGGIYLDFDVVVLSPVDPLLQYDVTLGRESPFALCNGVILAKKNAIFLRIWHQTYMNYSDYNIWGEHSILMPERLSRLYPEHVHVEEDSMQKPNWTPEEIKWIYDPNFILDWKQKYTLHLWYRFYKRDHTPSDIKTLNSTLGYVFRYIYYGSSNIMYHY